MENIKNQMNDAFSNINSLTDLESLRVNYIGKKGIITELYSKMKDLSNDEKKEYGMKVNELRDLFNTKYDFLKSELNEKVLNEKLESEMIDVTLPGYGLKTGSSHILDKVIEELETFYMSMGYDVVEGPEVEKDLYNFEMLNLQKGHPARDAQDTFYISSDEILLRSQTSPVQVRTMLEKKGEPFRIICPGKTYRRDYDDATHSHQFMQCEGMIVDKEISLSDLKGTLDLMAKHLFGKDVITRFRPSFYPFTEPSVEFDVSCFKCNGKGCNVCKGTTWITIGGAGVVHPNVLNMAGYDSEKYTGFAFGFGIERIAMVKYGVPDVRYFYTNDLRVCNEFERRGE
jgi:phenylalanyl-tRNA synthetase alpha chain